MSKTPNYDAKVKAILDATMPGERVCALTGEKWNMTEEEISWYKKFNVPPSNLSPLTRMSIHASFGTCFQWWWQKHPETGKPVLTCIHPASGIRVLPDEEWYEKDFSSIFLEFNLKKPFFESIYHLSRSIPIMATRNKEIPVNSISVVSLGDENDVLTFACKAKNSLFSIAMMNGESSSEIVFCNTIINSYNCLHSDQIFNSHFIRDSFACLNSSFLFDCHNCENCFGAVNRRHAKYIFWEELLSQGAYEKEMQKINWTCRSNLEADKKHFYDLIATKAI
ncbi:hypothetical protein CO172_02515 [Candidatus Uhrbacteria bacterium CG_4_9_14_3_um_filter_36_7]|uniref:Uncharacterized protein n=1 Tax=Candidatus Uhrbacteria bacterium CG_4_9_14_3_um_filter_36_7 TaxID=1975033 RepID=A0A2M7XHA8_9BACT|nr:MAG: hypothetical protein CO172_02515 [Candidatus Uhrbacteria bacterium CG_4_9_14_3_um_filter_36_7]